MDFLKKVRTPVTPGWLLLFGIIHDLCLVCCYKQGSNLYPSTEQATHLLKKTSLAANYC